MQQTLSLLLTNRGRVLDAAERAKFYIHKPGDRDDFVAWGHGSRTAVFPGGIPASRPLQPKGAGTLTLCRHVDGLRGFDFEAQGNIAPRKDLAYLDHRYL